MWRAGSLLWVLPALMFFLLPLRAAEVVWIDYLPGKGTRVTVNGTLRGIVPGADFNRALLGLE